MKQSDGSCQIAFRHFYDYHFAQNRQIWDDYIAPLSQEQFTQELSYAHGSLRNQLVHLVSVDDTWFSALRGEEIPEPLAPADFDDRRLLRARWDEVERDMRAYLAELRDELLFEKPFAEGEDKDLILWQVLLQVVNHGTDHRAQILRLLNDLGVKTSSQDYIFYVYEHPAALARLAPTAARPPAPFIPDDFPIPAGLETGEFRLRMLTVNDLVKDFEAVVTSAEHLKQVFPGGSWPGGLTLEQDLIDLGWHQKEFQRRTSFAYTVVAPDGSRVLGCVYVYPCQKRGYEAVVYLWARQSELAGGLEERLEGAVKRWMIQAWPFKRVAYPGRGMSWEAYDRLPGR